MSRQFATNVTTIYDILCPVPFLPSPFGFPKVQARERNPNLNFLVRICSGGVGVFHVKGWGPKSSVCPSKPGKPNLFWRDIPEFWWHIPEAPEKFEKKIVRVQFSFPKGFFCRNRLQ